MIGLGRQACYSPRCPALSVSSWWCRMLLATVSAEVADWPQDDFLEAVQKAVTGRAARKAKFSRKAGVA